VLLRNSHQLSRSSRRLTKDLRRAQRNAKGGMTATVVTLTPLGGVGLIAHGGAILEKLNQLINHSYEKNGILYLWSDLVSFL
jgi:hypothetical protein